MFYAWVAGSESLLGTISKSGPVNSADRHIKKSRHFNLIEVPTSYSDLQFNHEREIWTKYIYSFPVQNIFELVPKSFFFLTQNLKNYPAEKWLTGDANQY